MRPNQFSECTNLVCVLINSLCVNIRASAVSVPSRQRDQGEDYHGLQTGQVWFRGCFKILNGHYSAGRVQETVGLGLETGFRPRDCSDLVKVRQNG